MIGKMIESNDANWYKDRIMTKLASVGCEIYGVYRRGVVFVYRGVKYVANPENAKVTVTGDMDADWGAVADKVDTYVNDASIPLEVDLKGWEA